MVYVVDTGHNRVQAFEANAAYVYTDESHFTWQAGGVTAAAQWSATRINLPEWASSATRWVVPKSETVNVDGVPWAWVADLTGFTSAS